MFVRIDTDEGITGWGEGSFSFPHHGSEMIGLAVLAAREVLLGEDPTNIEPLWQKLFRRHTSVGARGTTSAAVSAIDIALWDITGKAMNRPVYQLLGGKMRDNGLRPELAWTCSDYAELLIERDAGGDAGRVTELQDEAIAIAQELGLRPLLERVLAQREILKA